MRVLTIKKAATPHRRSLSGAGGRLIIGAVGCQLLVAACSGSSRGESAASTTSGSHQQVKWCESSPVATDGWRVVAAQRAPFSVRLPPSSERLRGDTSEIWRTGTGTIGYAVTGRTTGWLDSAQTADTSRSICEDTVGGRRVRVQYHYGKEAFGEGHYLLAFWDLEPDRALELVAFSRSPGGRDTLFAIARSVRLAEP